MQNEKCKSIILHSALRIFGVSSTVVARLYFDGAARFSRSDGYGKMKKHAMKPIQPTSADSQASGGRRAEFEMLYERHSREVWALAYARWMNADTAMDIAQEAFLRLWKQWEAGDTIINPRAWLLRVARNLAEDHAKSAFRRNGTHSPQTMNGVQSNGPLPQELMEKEETFACLRGELDLLPQSDREILTLRYALDYNTEEIAELLAIRPTSVHMRLSRARQRLADRLKAQGVNQTE
jgi:RNA polymerase sigma-70 factor, ECF subfamily